MIIIVLKIDLCYELLCYFIC